LREGRSQRCRPATHRFRAILQPDILKLLNIPGLLKNPNDLRIVMWIRNAILQLISNGECY
jgi:hypothetical protein